MADPNTAAIYTRISRDEAGEGLGIQRQLEDCTDLAKRLGLTVVEVYPDNDISASDVAIKRKPRPSYAKMLADARAGRFTHIIAYHNSRLTRRMLELEELIQLHESTGVIIQTVKSGQDDLSTSDGRMVARIKASVDIAEADRISERAKRAHRQKAASGEVKVQGKRPFGFLADGVTHHPEEAPLIREAVSDILKGATITHIARRWEKLGVKTTTGNETWNWFPLRRALLSWRNAGVREYLGKEQYVNGELVMAEWEPIITVAERAQAYETLKEKAKTKTRLGKWLLSGLLICGKDECGRPLYGSLGVSSKQPIFDGDPTDTTAVLAHHAAMERYEKTHTYACNSERSSHLGISARRLEKYIELTVAAYVAEKEFYGVPDAPKVTIEDWPHEERLSGLSAKIETLMEAFNNDELSGEIVMPQVRRMDAERKTLRAERETFYAAQAVANRTDLSDNERLDQAFSHSITGLQKTFEDRQLALKQEIAEVVIGPGIRGNGGKSDEAFEKRIRIVWRQPHYDFTEAKRAAAENSA